MSEQLGHQLHVHSSISCDRSFTEKADICEDGFKDDFCQKTNWSVIISLPLKPSVDEPDNQLMSIRHLFDRNVAFLKTNAIDVTFVHLLDDEL